MKTIFICAPFEPVSNHPVEMFKETSDNYERMEKMCKLLIGLGDMPLAPHLYLDLFNLGKEIEKEQSEKWICCADEFWIISRIITPEMIPEIQKAVEYDIPIRCVNEPDKIYENLLKDIFSAPYADDEDGEEM